MVVLVACGPDSCPIHGCQLQVESKKLGARGPRRPHPPFNSTQIFLSLSSSRVFQPHFGRPSKLFLSHLPHPTTSDSHLPRTLPHAILDPVLIITRASFLLSRQPRFARRHAQGATSRSAFGCSTRHHPSHGKNSPSLPPAPSTQHFPSITMMTQSNVFYSN